MDFGYNPTLSSFLVQNSHYDQWDFWIFKEYMGTCYFFSSVSKLWEEFVSTWEEGEEHEGEWTELDNAVCQTLPKQPLDMMLLCWNCSQKCYI